MYRKFEAIAILLDLDASTDIGGKWNGKQFKWNGKQFKDAEELLEQCEFSAEEKNKIKDILRNENETKRNENTFFLRSITIQTASRVNLTDSIGGELEQAKLFALVWTFLGY